MTLINPAPVVHAAPVLEKRRSPWVQPAEAEAGDSAAALDRFEYLVGAGGLEAYREALLRGEEEKSSSRQGQEAREAIDALEIYSHIKDISDPEHPYTLEQLKVVTMDNIQAEDQRSRIKVFFTPTVEHCSMATLIGLCIRVKLLRALPPRFKVDIYVSPGSHATEAAVNKQLNDKERVAAALENPRLLQMVNGCLGGQAVMA